MKRAWVLIFVVAIFWCRGAVGDQAGYRYDARTGDQEFDLSLGELNVKAQTDMDGFVKKLSLSYGMPEKDIHMLITRENMPPADVYMSVKVAYLAQQPLDRVVQEYKVNRGKGWGVIAKNLGIKPGSKEFHALKRDESGLMGTSKDKGHGKGHGHGHGQGQGNGRNDD